MRDVPRWRDSDVYTDLERQVMAYAEAMTATPPAVTDEMVAGLRRELDDAALVELTMMVAVENVRSRFNSALGLTSQGFKDRCEIPARRRDRPPSPPFDRHRRLLFTVAYQMLGSVADAEDVVQETWLRWSAADRGEVADPRAYLVRITTRLALDRLGSARARRESYVGPWLPEPLLTGGPGGRGPAGARARGRRRARRAGVPGAARRAGDAVPGRAGGVRAARGLRDVGRRDRRGARPVPRPPSGRWRTGPGSTCRPGSRGSTPTGRRSGR